MPVAGGRLFNNDHLTHNLEVIKRLNALNINYDLITEDELFNPDAISKYTVIIIHDAGLLSKLFPSYWDQLASKNSGKIIADYNGVLDYTVVEIKSKLTL